MLCSNCEAKTAYEQGKVYCQKLVTKMVVIIVVLLLISFLNNLAWIMYVRELNSYEIVAEVTSVTEEKEVTYTQDDGNIMVINN